MTTTLPWLIYTRVSTDEQAAHGTSLAAQLASCQQYLSAHGYAFRHVEDGGFSGKDLQRPGMQEVLASIKGQQIAGVLVWKLDRLSRRLRDLLDLIELAQANHVALASIQERIDTAGPMGNFQLTILGAFAQLEREQIAERVRASIRHRKAQGLYYGGIIPPGLHAPLRNGQRRLEPDQRTGHVIADLWPRIVQGASVADLVPYLDSHGIVNARGGRWAPAGVSRLLANRRYIGLLVTEDQFDTAAEALRSRVSPRSRIEGRPAQVQPARPSDRIWPLRGLAVCACCGSALIGSTSRGNGGRRSYLRCSGRMRKNGCTARDLPAEDYERLVVAEVARACTGERVQAELLRRLAAAAAGGPQRREDLNRLTVARARILRRIDRLLALYLDEDQAAIAPTAIRPQLDQLAREREAIDIELAKAEGSTAAMEIVAGHIAAVQDALRTRAATLPTLPPDQLAAILPRLLARVALSDQVMELHLHLPDAALAAPAEGGMVRTEGAKWLPGPDCPRTMSVRIQLVERVVARGRRVVAVAA